MTLAQLPPLATLEAAFNGLEQVYKPHSIRGLCGGEGTAFQVTPLEASYIGLNLSLEGRTRKVIDAAMDWLRQPVSGALSYEGIRSRAYTLQESVAIKDDLPKVAETMCPFWEGNGCMIAPYNPPECSTGTRSELFGLFAHLPKEMRWLSWLPTLLLRQLDDQRTQEIRDDGSVADAKLALEKFRVF